jgi:hypothetical protein
VRMDISKPWPFLVAVCAGTFVVIVLAIEWRQVSDTGQDDGKPRLAEAGWPTAGQPWVSPTFPPPRATVDLRKGESVELDGGGAITIERAIRLRISPDSDEKALRIDLVLEGPHAGSVGYFMKSVAEDGIECPVGFGGTNSQGLAEGEKRLVSYYLRCDEPSTFQLEDLLFKIP